MTKPTQVPAIPESSGDLDPKDMKVVVLTINFLSLKLCSAYHPAVFRPLVEELGLGPLNCAANARDDICLQLELILRRKARQKNIFGVIFAYSYKKGRLLEAPNSNPWTRRIQIRTLIVRLFFEN
ncbi:hypothetical protein BFJ63_vAg15953 [Fusarium oxysporum f. sp. narcissi]|uniref:Uncharacterized protein n=1 Tax=Fusarium oxysporum f. sp. narcissi TaxID=451672 RepID=A0A4Q2V3A3_FUSOX|nr:hypothetical protein BFJ63_vAg15953 [Fusarium oxysporum f. sp. narcissi]